MLLVLIGLHQILFNPLASWTSTALLAANMLIFGTNGWAIPKKTKGFKDRSLAGKFIGFDSHSIYKVLLENGYQVQDRSH